MFSWSHSGLFLSARRSPFPLFKNALGGVDLKMGSIEEGEAISGFSFLCVFWRDGEAENAPRTQRVTTARFVQKRRSNGDASLCRERSTVGGPSGIRSRCFGKKRVSPQPTEIEISGFCLPTQGDLEPLVFSLSSSCPLFLKLRPVCTFASLLSY